MPTITTNGLGSNLDINTLVSTLVQAQSAPKTAQLDRLKSSTDSSISAFGQLTSALEAFSTSLQSLNSASSFTGLKATSSNESIARVTASNNAAAGSYQLTVTQLAAASKVSSNAVESGKTFSAGTLNVSIGDGEPMAVEIAEGATLEDVRKAINTQLKDQGITATIVSNPGDPQAGSRLILTTDKTGAGQDIRVDGAGGGLDVLNVNETQGSQLTRAANAEFELDGIKLSSPTNKVEGAVSGLTFELLKVTSDDEGAATVGVSADEEGLTASVQAFVDAYNKLVGVTNSLTRVSTTAGSTTASASALTGNSIARGLENMLRSELNHVTGGDGLQSLYDLGISTSRTGTLEIDRDRLSQALERNPDALVGFFTDENDGLLNRLDKQVTEYTRYGGIIQQQTSSLNNTLSDIQVQREAHELRMSSVQASLLAQFNAMDSLVYQLNGTGNSLLASLESLSNSSTR
ncbi:flagellar filament capping protein FliD [Pseudomonas sp. S5(2021)]|nr:flagellar filament capping protein FliD [Pseudomonas sp. S5(2021)]